MYKRLAQLESLLLTMKNCVLLLNAEREVIFLNESARRLLEFPINEKAHFQYLPKVVVSLVDQVFFENIDADGELEIVVEGEICYFQVSAQLVRDSTSDAKSDFCDPKMVLIVLHEVTRLHRLENLRREFVANVSHELKTPITSIKAAVETLQDGAVHDVEITPKFLDIIARQSDRLNNIIEDLLSLSRLENERDEVYLIEGSILEVIDDAIASCEVKAKAKDIEINVSCPQGLREKMNSALLEQALVNLIDNAIKYSDAGTSVTISAIRIGSELEISVSDQGRGIEAEHLSRIFERFYRVDKARSRHAGGSGLGLSIVKHIAQVHGGRAAVTSTPGVGSNFSLYLASS